jgi:hypothetical protein
MENKNKMSVAEIIYASRQARAYRSLLRSLREENRVKTNWKETGKYNTKQTQ